MLKNRFFYALAALCVLTLLCRVFLVENLGIDLYVDEAQYWIWSKNLDFGYFSKPPGIALQIWLSTQIFGDTLIGVKFLSMLCYVLASLLIFALIKQLNLSDKIAFYGGITTLTLPIFAWLGLFASTDSLLVLEWILALYFFVQIVENQRNQILNSVILGAILGFALLTKYTAAAWFLCAFLYLCCYKREFLISKKIIFLLIVLAISLLIFSPNLWWNYQQNFPTLRHTAEITIQKKSAGGFIPFAEFVLSQWLISGGIIFVIFLKIFPRVFNNFFWNNGNQNAQTALNLGVFFSLPLWIIVALQALNKNANANWAAPAFIPAILAVCAYYDFYKNNAKKIKIFIAINVISVLITLLAYSWQNILPLFVSDSQKISKLNFYKRAQGWHQMADSILPLLQSENKNINIILLAENRTLISHLSYELRDFVNVNFADFADISAENPKKIRIISWNPQQTQSDYFQMISDLNKFKNQPNYVFFFVSDNKDAVKRAKFADYFQSIDKKYYNFGNSNSDSRKIYLLKMQNFKGYKNKNKNTNKQ